MRVTLIQTEVDGSLPLAERVAGVAAAGRSLHRRPRVAARAVGDRLLRLRRLRGHRAAAGRPGGAGDGRGRGGGRGRPARRQHASSGTRPAGCSTPACCSTGTARCCTRTGRCTCSGTARASRSCSRPGERVGAHGRLALSTCYDLRFPELFRAQVDDGSQLFLVAAAWPLARLEHWQLLLRARALENQSFLLACNAAGRQGEVELAGRSAVVDPWGTVLAEAGDGPETLTVEIDPDLAVRARKEFPALADRRL